MFEPSDIASLVAFRVLFGLLMSVSMIRFLAKGWVQTLYLQPTYFFTYPGLSSVQLQHSRKLARSQLDASHVTVHVAMNQNPVMGFA